MDDVAAIHLAEDREDDIVLVQKTFAKARIPNPLFLVRDGEEAINYLAGSGPFCNRTQYPLPALVLLDLKMPRVDGFQVLQWLKIQPTLNAIRVVVLTSSDDIHDVSRAYQLGANSFLVKPLDFRNAVALVDTITDDWMSLNTVAGRNPGLKSFAESPVRNESANNQRD